MTHLKILSVGLLIFGLALPGCATDIDSDSSTLRNETDTPLVCKSVPHIERITINPKSGAAPMAVSLEVVATSEINLDCGKLRYGIDQDGDGETDILSYKGRFQLVYQTPGTYFTKVIVDLEHGSATTSATMRLIVSPTPE